MSAAYLPPPGSAPASDLTDAELDELNRAVAALPDPIDLVGLDGFLCGTLVQPHPVEESAWLDPAWPPRVAVLLRRRHAALRRAIVEDGVFDPLIFEFDDSHPIAVSEYEPAARLPPVSQALMPWVAGFRQALQRFPALTSLGEPKVDEALVTLHRHLPPPDALERDVHPGLESEQPLEGLDAAIDELVASVVQLADLGLERRYRVETVRRAGPKIGRNDPCPCGSGRKFKSCCGAG